MLGGDGAHAMSCASCGQTNPTGARFCSGCGASLAPRCAACGAESPAGARFCNGCGAALVAPLARPTADAVSRKIVTIVFADLIGSVSLHERLDAESARRLMDRYHRAMSAAVDVHGGRVVQLLGDGVLAASPGAMATSTPCSRPSSRPTR
jgi:class 3 adenylate cyclase